MHYKYINVMYAKDIRVLLLLLLYLPLDKYNADASAEEAGLMCSTIRQEMNEWARVSKMARKIMSFDQANFDATLKSRLIPTRCSRVNGTYYHVARQCSASGPPLLFSASHADFTASRFLDLLHLLIMWTATGAKMAGR